MTLEPRYVDRRAPDAGHQLVDNFAVRLYSFCSLLLLLSPPCLLSSLSLFLPLHQLVDNFAVGPDVLFCLRPVPLCCVVLCCVLAAPAASPRAEVPCCSCGAAGC